MQTKKMSSGRAATQDHAGTKVSRVHKRMSENLQVVEKKVADLIMSSARKHKLGRYYQFFFLKTS